MNEVNEWASISELLTKLIAKYYDVLDIDTPPCPDITSEDTRHENMTTDTARLAICE